MLTLLRRAKALKGMLIFYAAGISYPAWAIHEPDRPESINETLKAYDALSPWQAVTSSEQRYLNTPPSSTLAANEKNRAPLFQTTDLPGHQDHQVQDRVLRLLRALSADQSQTRQDAAQALGRLGKAAEHAMPALLVAAGDSRWEVRADAVWAIGKVTTKEQASSAVSVLTTALDDPSDHVRWSATWSLARIGPAAETAVPALIEKLNDPARKIRASALSALTRVASQSSHDVILPALFDLKDDADQLVRKRAAAALRALKSASDASLNP